MILRKLWILLVEDGDIDNDGDQDDSDEYLANRRKAIAKAIKKQNGDK